MKQESCYEEKHVIKREDIIAICSSSKYSLRDRALLSFVYITGCRRYEASLSIANDIRIKSDQGYAIFHLHTAKKRDGKKHYRNNPIDLDLEKGIIEPLISFLKINTFPGRKLWPGKRRISQIIKQITGHGCHCLRHTRTTDLVNIYDFDTPQLMKWHGWDDPEMAKEYTHLKTRDILFKIRRSKVDVDD